MEHGKDTVVTTLRRTKSFGDFVFAVVRFICFFINTNIGSLTDQPKFYIFASKMENKKTKCVLSIEFYTISQLNNIVQDTID